MNDGTTLSIAAYDMPETDTLENQGGEFEKLTGIYVAVARLSAEEMEKKVLEEFEKRAGTYDIVDVSAAAIPAFAPHLEPLDDRILQSDAQIRVKDWSPRFFNMYTRYRGQTLALPWRGNAYLLYYRKDLFERENLEPPTNFNKLLRAAKRFHRPDKDFYGFASAQHNGLHICLDWLPVLWGFGGEIYSETISALLNSEEAVKALEYYIERNNYAATGILDFGYYEPLRLMQEGRVAMMQQWSMAAANLENPVESKVSGKVGYLPAPGYPVIGGGGLGINKYGMHKEVAWEFIKWFTSPEVEKERVTIGGSPTRNSSFREPELLARYPYIVAVEQALMVGRQRPRHEEWNKIQDIIGEAVWLASAGTKAPTEALASANARVQEILEWSKKLLLLNTVSSSVSRSLNVEEILNNVLDKMIEIEIADAGAACLLDETTGKPFLVLQWGGSSGLVEKVAPSKIDEELVRRVVQSEEIYVELYPTGREIFKKEHSEAISAGELQSFVGFRIGTKNRPIGIVIIAFRRPRRFSSQETNLLTVIGRQVGQAIENARLYEEAQRELTERKRVEEALRESELMFQSLIGHAPFSIWVCDGQGTIIFANQAALDLFGVTDPAQIIGCYNIYRDTTEAEKPLLAYFERAWAGEVVRYRQDLDMTTVKYDTSRQEILHFYATLLFTIPTDSGQRPNIVVIQEDITEKVRAEEHIQHLQSVLKAIRNVNQLIVYENNQRKLLQGACEILNQTRNYKLVWIGLVKEGTKDVLPVAQAGFEEGYLDSVKITWDDSETGKGPTGTAIRTQKPFVMHDIAGDSRYKPWREEAMKRGYASSVAVPLVYENRVFGALNVYATIPDSFDEEEINILLEVSQDIAFALHNIEMEKERKRAEKELQERRDENTKLAVIAKERSELQEWINTFDTFVGKFDPNGVMIFCNEAPIKMGGVTKDDVFGKYFPDTKWWSHSEIEKARIVECFERAKAGLPSRIETNFRSADGTPVPIIFNCQPVMDDDGKVKYITAEGKIIIEETRLRTELQEAKEALEIRVRERTSELVEANEKLKKEIAERKRAEEALRKAHEGLEAKVAERTRELVQANIQLREIDRLKSEFLATMSHELRTPLNSIIGFVGIILKGIAGEINQEQRKQLSMVYSSAKHLLGLINDILDLSRIEAGKMEISMERFKIKDVISEVAQTLSPMISQKGLRLITEIPDETPEVFSDRKKVLQILSNLVNNAVKFTSKGEIKIECNIDNDNLKVSVSDTGIGIKRENMDYLFEAFRQIDGTAQRRYQGAGLGLYLCKKLVTLLGGKIWAESEYGKGSKFTFTLLLRLEEGGQHEKKDIDSRG